MGRSQWERLRARHTIRNPARIRRAAAEDPAVIFAFDLLWLNGRDLRPEPWIKRQKLLAPLNRAARNFVVADYILGRGKDLFELVCAEDLEAVYTYLRTIPAISNHVPEPLPPTARSVATHQ